MSIEWIEQLIHCKSKEEIRAAIDAHLPGHGFDHWLYAIRFPVSATRKQNYAAHNFPLPWWEMYQRHCRQNTDPLAHHCEHFVAPVAWLADDHSHFLEPLTTEGKRILRGTTETGIAGGIAVPIRDSGLAWGGIMLGLGAPRSMQFLKRSIPFVLHFAVCLHQAFCRIGDECRTPLAPQLSGREVECLGWAAEGKTSREISQLLDISERTVVFHLQNASAKLGVVTRQQAIARSIMLGVLSP
jgi:DNA-binding CsgD family transcriptional regulator